MPCGIRSQPLRDLDQVVRIEHRCIQAGMLKNNPQPVKMSVGEVAEVLGSLVNTHKHLIESGVEFQKELESHSISRRMGLLRRPR